jgi:hypothetical protein
MMLCSPSSRLYSDADSFFRFFDTLALNPRLQQSICQLSMLATAGVMRHHVQARMHPAHFQLPVHPCQQKIKLTALDGFPNFTFLTKIIKNLFDFPIDYFDDFC